MAHDKRVTARRVEVATSATAGTVAGALGASKLRDAYAKEHPARYVRGEKHLARAIGARPAKFLAHAEPGFKPLVAGTATAVTAAVARRHREKEERRAMAKSQDGDGVLVPVQNLDAKVRAVRVRVVPTKSKLVQSASNATGKIKADVQRDLGKAYDPKVARRHRAQVVEYTAGAAAAGVGAVGVREARDAQGQWTASAASEAQAARDFGRARQHGATVAERLARHARAVQFHSAKAQRAHRAETLAVNRTNLVNTFGHHQDEWRGVDRGIAHLVRAYEESQRGHALARAAKGKFAVAGGLVAVSLGARHQARRQR